ncbi:MAG: L-lactate permease [Chloroflexi bacterium]|nr:L-lactate permease [Chloroflexota bacterium]
MLNLTWINWLLALAPVLTVLLLMLVFRWGGSKAGAAAWFMAVLVALLFFGAGPRLLGYAQARAVLLTLDVLYIIWMALLLFHVADEAGAIEIIGEKLPALTPDRTIQALLLSWVFVSFLQGMGGFGVPVAIVAPLLVGMGFTAVQAVVMASIGHGWAVTFGSLGTSFAALQATTGVSDRVLAPESALLLGVASLVSGAIVAYVAAGWGGLRRALPALIVLSLVMGGVQYILATNGLWTLGATGGALSGLVVGVGISRLPFYQPAEGAAPLSLMGSARASQPSLLMALAAYGILIVLALGVNLVPALDMLFNAVRVTLMFPELATSLGWITPAGPGRSLSVFGHPGAILLYTSLIAYLVYHRLGYYEDGAAGRIVAKMSKSAVKSSLGIAAMVGMATTMSHAGMTNLLARGLSESVSAGLYPVVAPFIGTLGAFMTGSNTNSNVVFGLLQLETARLLGLSVSLTLAAQTAGASLGSVFAPAKVIVGSSTVGLAGEEDQVIRQMLIYGLIPVAVIALIVWGLAQL